MFMLHVFSILLCNHISNCQNNAKTEDFDKSYLLNFESKKTAGAMTTKDPHDDLVDTLMKNVDNVFGEWDYTEKTAKNNLHHEILEDQELDLRNLKQAHVVLKQIKHDAIPLTDMEVPGFAARPQFNGAKIKTSATVKDRPFSPESLFPMTGPLNTLIINNALRGNQSLTANSYNVSNIKTVKYRSCIHCNNLENPDCNDPRNGRLGKVIECQDKDDVCFSQHTPFGVVYRGCYNTRNNMTTYVCACNLCNHISISDMPYIFKTKKDWAKNVIELSRMKYLTKSVFKDMKCLRCEVNGTYKSLVSDGDIMDEVNCLSPSNIELMKAEQCGENYICGVISKANEHYIWRGCVQAPLYNYWLQICNTNLCNQDPIASIYS